MWTLGVNAPPAGWHEPAVCLVDERGTVVAYAEEERLIRRRHALFAAPTMALEHCLGAAGITRADVDVVAIGWDTDALFPRRYTNDAHFLAGILGWSPEEGRPEVVHVGHHRAHATSAFYASPFSAAGVLVVDGVGEAEATSIWRFEDGTEPTLCRSWPRHQSLGYAYDAASRWLGFSFLDAGKTMGLAAYGRAARIPTAPLVDVTEDDYDLAVTRRVSGLGRHSPAESAAEYRTLITAWRGLYDELADRTGPTLPVPELHRDPAAVLVAWTAQGLIEHTVGWLARHTRAVTGLPALCMAGGVALNCSTNGQLDQPLYVPPVPHDAGVALGAAWHVSPPRSPRIPFDPYRGPNAAHHSDLDLTGIERVDLSIERVTSMLSEGRVGAVVEGRSEVGPRALCHRSVIAVPRPASIHGRLNDIKHREPWRPFGPVATVGTASRLWRERGDLTRYMVGATLVTETGALVAPAVVHADGTTRPQNLRSGEAPVVEALLGELDRQGDPAVLINTSFNDKGQPIVNTAAEAVDTLRRLKLDFLVLGDDLLLPTGMRTPP
jgi:carbamoyltransferase